MNKKLIILIVTIIIIVIIGIVIFMVTSNNNENNEVNNTNENNNEINNNNNNENLENDDDNNSVTSGENILVVYFSESGNTEVIANYIHDEVGGALVKLEPVNPYPENYNELLDVAQEEQRSDARPEIATVIDNIDQYDTIFIGYPNWWGDMPMLIYTFLETYDLSGKTIAPFNTSGGSGLSRTVAAIREEQPNATVTDGFTILGDNVSRVRNEVNDWLSEIGL